MASFKRLKRSDVISVPYVANKRWIFNYDLYPSNDQYIKIYKGTNLTGSFSLDTDPITEGKYERLLYSQINHLFYQQNSSSNNTLDSSSLIASLYYDGASSNKLTGSNFDYNNNQSLIKLFPTGANEGIRVISINKDLYGQQILPYAFELSSSAYFIKDDGIGNLIDFKNSSSHVGNIFYSHGLAIITDQEYQTIFPLTPLSSKIVTTFPTSSATKSINIISNVNGRGGLLLTGSITIDNTSSFSVDGSGSLILTETAVGTYYTLYNVSSSFTGSIYSGSYLISNTSPITASIYNDYSAPTPTPSPTPTPTPTPTLYVVSVTQPNPPISASIVTINEVIPEPPTNVSVRCSYPNALSITFKQPEPFTPTNGYIIGYRRAGSRRTHTEFSTSTFYDIQITGITYGVKYEGYIKSFSGNGLVSDSLSWYHECPAP
jgi:hypothetical protein